MMASDELLKKIFEHQLLLSQEIQKRLESHLTDELKTAFHENEVYLHSLIEKNTVDPEDLEKLQGIWEGLTTRINQIQKETSGTMSIINSQEQISKLYN